MSGLVVLFVLFCGAALLMRLLAGWAKLEKHYKCNNADMNQQISNGLALKPLCIPWKAINTAEFNNTLFGSKTALQVSGRPFAIQIYGEAGVKIPTEIAHTSDRMRNDKY